MKVKKTLGFVYDDYESTETPPIKVIILSELRQLLEDKIKRIGESESIFFNDLGGPAHAEGMKVAYEDMLAFVKKLDSDEK